MKPSQIQIERDEVGLPWTQLCYKIARRTQLTFGEVARELGRRGRAVAANRRGRIAARRDREEARRLN